jgi:integrase
MQPQKFTDMTIQSAKPPAEGRTTLWDSASPLGLRITSKGAKTFVVILGRRRHTIGRYGRDGITLSQARTAAKQLKAEHTLGRLIPSSRGVSEAVPEYLASITVRPNTRIYYERHLHRLPPVRLSDLGASELNRIFDPLPVTSRGQALQVYISFFNWCIRRHYLDTSPCIRFKANKATSRERVLSDQEIARIWLCLERPTTDLPTSFCRITQLLLLSGQRKNEIANICASWIHNDKIVFPKEITKNGKIHQLPLSATAISILDTKRHQDGTDLVFPATGTNEIFNSWSTAKPALDKASGVTDWTIHDIRRSVASGMSALGVRVEVIERILNHRSGSFAGVAGVYIRDPLWDEQVAALQKWDNHLKKITTVHSGELTAVPP